ncbi:hypothetical protein JCM6882_003618 [Rhodosporidiobolus microsporus]
MDGVTEETAQEGPQAVAASPVVPFHHQPLSFPLPTSPSDLASLTTSQLALSWIAPHPDWDDAAHPAPVFGELRARWDRFQGAEERGEEDEDALFVQTGLEWDLPSDLDGLESEKLALLPLHPSFDDSLIEPARAIFRARRAEPDALEASSPATVIEEDAFSVSNEDEVVPSVGADSSGEKQDVILDVPEMSTVAPVSPSSPDSPFEDVDPDATLVDAQPVEQRPETDAKVVDDFFDGLEVSFSIMKAMKGAVSAEEPANGTTVETSPSEYLPHMSPAFVAEDGHVTFDEPDTRRSRGSKKQKKKRPKPYSRSPRPRDPSSLVPASLTRTWTTIFVSNVSNKLSTAQVWDLLSPRHLPEPIAVRLLHAKGTKWSLCFVAYETPEDAHLASIGLCGASYGDEGVQLDVSATEKKPEEYEWKWDVTSTEYRQRYEHERPSQPNGRSAPFVKQGHFRSPSRPSSPPFVSSSALPPSDVSSPAQPGDPVPLHLLQNCQSILLDNLPIDVCVSAISAYLPPDTVIGISLNNPYDPFLHTGEHPVARGSAFLLFSNSATAGDLAHRAFSKQFFPGGKVPMWWQRRHKPTPWVWSEMAPEWAAVNSGPLAASASSGVGAGSTSSSASFKPAPRDEVEEKRDADARREAWGRSANLRREAELLREHHHRREDDRYAPSEPSRPYAPYPPPPSHFNHRSSYRDYQQPLSHDYRGPSYSESSSSYHDQRAYSPSSYSQHSHSHPSQHFHPQQQQHFSHRDESFSSHYSRSGPPNPREGPPTTRTPFHLLPLSFSLSPTSLSSLTTTQLALAWIAPHPDWVEHTHWSLLFAEWRKRRERSKLEGRTGNERDKDEGREGDAMDRMRMGWKIPDELEKLNSAQLAALPMHPDFHPLLVEEARRIFRTRREHDLARVPLPPPDPTQKTRTTSGRRNTSTPPQRDFTNFVPRDFMCRWTTIFVGSVLATLPHSVVWALLSPPNLPEPVAIRLISKERGLPKTFAFCFVAYESKREAIEACHGLDGAEYGDGTKQYRLVPEMSDKPAQAVTWEWVTARENFRERFEPSYRQRRQADLSSEFKERQPVKPDSPARPTGDRFSRLPSASPPSLLTDGSPSADETASSSALLPPPSPPPLPHINPSSPEKPSQSSIELITSSSTSSREDFLRATLLARKRDREIKEKEPSSQQDDESDSSLPHKLSFPPSFPRPPSRPRAMRLAGFDHTLPFQQASSSFASSSSLPRAIVGVPQRAAAPVDTAPLAALRQAAQSSRFPSSPA